MGLFLQMAAVAAPKSEIEKSVNTLQGDMAPREIISTSENKTLIIFNDYFSGASDICKNLSKDFSAPTFYLHVHDGDLWMYEFFVEGQKVDAFNTKPDYWGNIESHEEKEWEGNVDVIVKYWPEIKVDSIKKYLVNHSTENLDLNKKAYPDDEFPYWDCWQVVDFMKKIDVPYPDYDEESDVNQEKSKVTFKFDLDSLILIGLGIFGLYERNSLSEKYQIGGLVIAILLISGGIIGFFKKKTMLVFATFIMFTLSFFAIYLGVNFGFQTSRVILIFCGLGGAVYFIKEYKDYAS